MTENMCKKFYTKYIKDIVPCIALLVSIISAIFSWNANSISKEANIIAQSANDISKEANIIAQNANNSSDRSLQIEENRKLNENKEKSVGMIENIYDKIMYNHELYDIYERISWNKLVWDEEYLQRFVDEFEGLWWKYCQEQIYKWDLQLYSQMFRKLCLNDVVIQKYWWNKNAFSKICLDLVWSQWMWTYYKENGTCNVLK